MVNFQIYFFSLIIFFNVISEPIDLGHIKEFNNIFKFLTPYKINNLSEIRLGRLNDGGYFVPQEMLNSIFRCYNYGVADDISFEQELVKINPRAIVRSYDHTVEYPEKINDNIFFKKEGISAYKTEQLNSLYNHLAENNDLNKNILLKMDIEGAEWEILDKINPAIFSQIPVMVVEFHWFKNTELAMYYENILNKISKYFTPFYVHGNNCSNLLKVNNKLFPDVIEATYINNKYVEIKKIRDAIIESNETVNAINSPYWEVGLKLDYWINN